MSGTLTPAPRWAVVTTGLLSLIGLGLSLYLTIAHFRGTSILACSETGAVNCALVTTSKYSRFLGMPVAVLGLGHYVVTTALNSPWAWRSSQRWIHLARVGLALVGFGFILWLIAAELVFLNHICLWCTGVHVVTLALLLVLSRVSPSQLGWAGANA
ncbi:MAG: vitamin K epoxide reductase family protein [Actinomycetota bacterium]